jgi:hypothetical protein
LGGSVGFLSVSDILLTASGQALAPTALPLREKPIFHHQSGRSLAGAAQKTVTFGRTIVSWSGPISIAYQILRYIRKATKEGDEYIDRVSVSKGSNVSFSDALKIQLIYSYVDIAANIKAWAWRCQRKQIGGTDAIFGGSGGPPYADTTEVTPPNDAEKNDDLMQILTRAFHQLVSESITDDTLDQHYGGWIELAVCRKDHFAKIPYAIKLWHIRGNKQDYSPGPLLFSFYKNHNLIVAKVSFEDLNRISRDVFFVADPLRRDPGQVEKNLQFKFNPFTICHTVLDTEGKAVDTFMTAGDDLGYRVSVSAGFTVSEEIEPRFWAIITGQEPSPGVWLVD